MSEATEAIRRLAAHLSEAADTLHEAGGERRARWLASAFAHLSRPDSELGREAVSLLARSAGLSEPMVAWALESALASLTFEVLHGLWQAPPPPRPGAVRARAGNLCVVVLAGNVFTAAARAVGYPLLYGWPVLAKASSQDDGLPRLLEAALMESCPTLGAAYRVVTYPAEQETLNDALFELADAVAVYGSDQTVNALRAQAGATVDFMGHGHGLGAAYVGAGALRDERQASEAARALAFDVAAYDQRGCLSPHVAWVARDGAIPPREFAAMVERELAQLAVTLPRGPLPYELAGAQLGWRGVGALRGSLLEGDGYAVSFEEDGPLRVSPGYRNLQLLAIEDGASLREKLAPLGVHLKCLAVSDDVDVARLAQDLPARVAPRLCALGQMQLPAPEALHDALPPWDGLVRWLDCTLPERGL